jgi:hypothetical protein
MDASFTDDAGRRVLAAAHGVPVGPANLNCGTVYLE